MSKLECEVHELSSIVEMLVTRGTWTDAQLLDMVKLKPDLLRFVAVQTPQMCLVAVSKAGHTLVDVKKRFRTPEVELAAVRSDGLMLEHIKNPTDEMYLAAVTQTGYALQWVPEEVQARKPELCRIAVTNTGYALQYVYNKTERLCWDAVAHSSCAAIYVPPEIRRAWSQVQAQTVPVQ